MTELLRVDHIESSYGASQVLFGISLNIGVGEVVTLLGKNGMGKTTTIKSIMGIMKPNSGNIYFKGNQINGEPSFKVAQAGIGLVPEGRQIFPNLSVYENLVATAANRRNDSDPWTVDKIFTLFPALADRQLNAGNQLSGGEQQMLAISRALMTNPDLLILDEATEGLAPLVRDDIWRVLEELKSVGQSILVIDKNVEALTKIANKHYIIEKGTVVWSGSSKELSTDKDIQHRYLGV
jgi:branched-chain amino acid transport system ATP-binding protein